MFFVKFNSREHLNVIAALFQGLLKSDTNDGPFMVSYLFS